MQFEKLGAFYLGKVYDPRRAETRADPLLYDSKDLTTHGLIVGMTGSGKTGLSTVLLEEALLDGVPALVIDPKGDMANLLLRFSDLSPEAFAQWIDLSEAARRGVTLEEMARDEAVRWERGLLAWGQSKDRLAMLERAGPVRIFTPGSASGRPLALLRSFECPSEEVRGDTDAIRERVQTTVSALLGLAGIEADPLTSREHILLSNLVEHAWSKGETTSLEKLVRASVDPPFSHLGALDLETFFPAKERLSLATRLNSLLASPAFASWLQGEPLDVSRLLRHDDGRPCLSVLYVAHLSDVERMFFVTLFLEEVIGWMRVQDGTGSLRAILYMDEVFGFFPPIAAPPSKAPMLTLLKQARAFGLGVVLATQNPVDLDYKGLSNIGTWFLGRLQTARDRERLMEGLQASEGSRFDRAETERLLSSLPKRTFFMHDVHEDAPALFETRWAMSYLRGPLTLEQVKRIATPASTEEREPETPPRPREPGGDRPQLTPDVEECFLAPAGEPSLIYRPFLLAKAQLHYVSTKSDLDHWDNLHWLTPLEDPIAWQSGEAISPLVLEEGPADGVSFAPTPSLSSWEKTTTQWKRSLAAFLYRVQRLELFSVPELELYSRPHDSAADFRSRCAHARREKRDEELERLRERFAPKLARLEEAILRAEAQLERESSQYGDSKLETAMDFGVTLAGALFGRKLGNVTRARRAARSASRVAREHKDVERARARVEFQKEKLEALEAELVEKTAELQKAYSGDELPVTSVLHAPRKSDVVVERIALAWRR